MNFRATNVAILGSTGSIGCSTLDVISNAADRMNVYALTTHTRLKEAVEQACRFRPRWLVATEPEHCEAFTSWDALPRETQLLQVHICNGMGWDTANPVTRVQAAARMKISAVLLASLQPFLARCSRRTSFLIMYY